MEPEAERPLSLGCPVEYGVSAVGKRLGAFARHWPLHGERLLDMGCGNGAYTSVLADGFREVHAIDIEPARLDEFRKHVDGDPRFHIAEGTAERLEFPDDYFDVITAVEVLEHVVNVEQAVTEAHRALRPGGAFLVSCPNRLFPLETHTVALTPNHHYPARWIPFLPYVKPLHRRFATARNFTPRDLRELMCPRGFEVVAWDWIMPPLDNWTIGTRFLRRALDGLERSRLRTFGVSVIGVFVKPG